MLGIKQEALAITLGDDWNQKKVSRLEEKEDVDDELLKQVADALHVTREAIKNFDEQKTINIFSNTFQDDSTAYSYNYKCNFNPLDKVVQLYDEKVELYERMLKDKSEMIGKLEGLLKNKQLWQYSILH